MLRKLLGSLSWLLSRLQSAFITGFLTILPLSLTAILIRFAYATFHKYFSIMAIPAIIVTLILIGVLAEYIIFQTIVYPFERIIDKIPFIGAFYSGVRSMANFFAKRRPEHKRQVVLIEYPQKNNYHLAILIDPADNSYSKILPGGTSQKMVKVFMPMTHFTMGYFLIVPEKTVIYTDIKFSEAVKAIVSGGLITPHSLQNLEIDSNKNDSLDKN